jgi:uncharacterized protein
MLIEFSAQNFRSLWDTQTLKMTAGPTDNLLEENTFQPLSKALPRLLRSAVIYGPNGAGKSNLIAALDFMQSFVLSSSTSLQEGEPINRVPFLLHSEGPSTPSEVEVVFIENGTRYQYGFACTSVRIVHEWLFVFPENKAQRWFERSFNPITEKEEYYFGSKFLGTKKTWETNTRSNALFLSTAVQLNSDQLKPVFGWFKSLVVIRHGERIDPSFTIESCENAVTQKDILNFMKNADISVDGIDIEERKLSAAEIQLPKDMPSDQQNMLKKALDGKTIKQVKLIHYVGDSRDTVQFPLEEESDGTQKLFAYAAPWLDVLKNGRVLIVDELDNSFHPNLVRFLLKSIHNPMLNSANGQLIFSTHDTSILDQKLLRRDQVWFVEKDAANSSRFYSLSDFRPRKSEALEKGYLQGRYGALPYIGEVKF